MVEICDRCGDECSDPFVVDILEDCVQLCDYCHEQYRSAMRDILTDCTLNRPEE